MKFERFPLLHPIVPRDAIVAAKSDCTVQPVENSRNPVEKLWISWGEASINLWKQCGFRGENLR